MSDYKKDTVGWFLNTLKEPLRTYLMKRFPRIEELKNRCHTLNDAIHAASLPSSFDMKLTTETLKGIKMYFQNKPLHNSLDDHLKEGYNMAKACAPDAPENPAPGRKSAMQAWYDDLGKKPDPSLHQYPLATDEVFTPAVVGYTPPAHIETIEERHDREIRELQARVNEQQEQIDKIVSAFNDLLSALESHRHTVDSYYGTSFTEGFENIARL